VGLIAGNEKVINVIRIHNSTFAVMIPEICQLAAQAALESFGQGDGKEDINAYVTTVLQRTTEGWRNLGWPEEDIHPPSGGFKYLTPTPPGIRPQGSFSGAELLDFYIASRANVKLSTSRSFNPMDDRFLRMVLMQNTCEVDEVFRRLRSVGVSYDMTLPEGLAQEYEAFLSQHAGNDF
jgi:aspartate/methionine/tyrosine aminotransferase